MNGSEKLSEVPQDVNKNGDSSFQANFKGFVSIFHRFIVNNL